MRSARGLVTESSLGGLVPATLVVVERIVI